ncbi:MAG: arylsulfatase [Pirellulales bacterium]|nr:arylsulfatase [Pirellulales bacterium]
MFHTICSKFFRIFLSTLGATWIVGFVVWGGIRPCNAAEAAPNAKRPNVIVLLTDDQGYGDLSCHGNPVIKTPNLDRLHSEGVRLTDFHVEPMCTPTRAQLISGVDALYSGAMNVSSGRTLLRRDLPTLADLFAQSGYRTGIFGKWHLGDTYPYRPIDRGFDTALWFRSSYLCAAADYWNNDYFNDHYRWGDQPQSYEGYCTDVFFNHAIDWLKDRKDRGEPFFLYLPTNAPHAPLYVPEKYRKEYESLLADQKMDEKRREFLARFFGMIVNIDENLGRLEDVLRETGLRDNTILVFMTDNGGTFGVPFYNAGMKGGKITLWEGGHRVPCFVRWPAGGIGGGRDVAGLTEAQDLLPTLVDLCGLKVPEGAKFDGVSLAKVLKDENEKVPDRMLVVQFSRMDSPYPKKNDATVLWKHWRLTKGNQLYDLQTDPHQDHNVIKEHPDVAAKMQAHYDRWWAGIEPQLDHFQPSVIGAPQQNPTRLCACDWADVFLDQRYQVLLGEKKNGLWHVEVARPGRYEIELRRWPREADAALTAGLPPHVGEDCKTIAGKALPIAQARLRVGKHDVKTAVVPGDKKATFTVELPKGDTTLQTWFYDADGKELCGAYYVYVRRLQD